MNTSQELQGQVAVITGGGRGIGAAVAQRLAVLGATVIICGRSLPALRRSAAAIEATGGLEYTAQLARSEAERALTALDTLPGSPYKDGLMALARFSVEHTT